MHFQEHKSELSKHQHRRDHHHGRNHMLNAMGRGDRKTGGHGRHHNDDGFDRHGRSPLLRGRKFNSDDIQLLIRYFLSLESSYGYELIKQFNNRSNGFYTPSPGVIYPALTYLEEIEHITVQTEGTRKRYSLSQLGQQYLEEKNEMVEALLAKLDHFAEKMKSVNEAIKESDKNQMLTAELMQALSNLKQTLQIKRQAAPEIQKQVAQMINDTIEQIKNLKA